MVYTGVTVPIEGVNALDVKGRKAFVDSIFRFNVADITCYEN